MLKGKRNFYLLAISFSFIVFLTLIFTLVTSTYQKTASISVKAQILPSETPPDLNDYIVISETPVPTNTPVPTRTPTPTPKPVIITDLDAIMDKYAKNESVSFALLKKIAQCESGFNSGARNGIYGGMFQFSEGSWRSTRQQMNSDPNPDLRFSAEESIKTAAFKIALNGVGNWPICSK